MRLSLLLAATLAATPVLAQDLCMTEMEHFEIAEKLDLGFGDVAPRFDCVDPMAPGEDIACLTDNDLLAVSHLAEEAYVYAYENATGTKTDHANPPIDEAVEAELAACTDADCLCGVYRQQISDALGGLSPLTN